MFGSLVAGLLVFTSVLLVRRGRTNVPAMSVAHSTVVCTLPSLRCEARLEAPPHVPAKSIIETYRSAIIRDSITAKRVMFIFLLGELHSALITTVFFEGVF